MAKELLFSITKKDLKLDYYSGSGAGGQHRNKHMNCVRLTHIDSNITVTGQSNRDRIANTKEAFNNLVNNIKFKLWMNNKINEVITGKTLEQKVEELMQPENLKIEALNEKGQWTVVGSDERGD